LTSNHTPSRTLRTSREIAVALLLFATAGCTKFENALAAIPVFSFLRDAPFFDPYEAPRAAPLNSVPFSSPAGDAPALIANTEVALTAFGTTVTNPLVGDTLALSVGKVMYDRHCSVCHGPAAKGDGPILNKAGESGKFPFAPNLTLAPSVNRTDGYLYGIIAAGRGLMPAYGPRMNHAERWAAVMYLRQLQQQSGAAVPVAPAPAPAPGR